MITNEMINTIKENMNDDTFLKKLATSIKIPLIIHPDQTIDEIRQIREIIPPNRSLLLFELISLEMFKDTIGVVEIIMRNIVDKK